MNYSFNWDEVFTYSLRKAIITESDILMRLKTFPVALFDGISWFIKPFEPKFFKKKILKIAVDFLLASENSLGKVRTPITEAKILH